MACSCVVAWWPWWRPHVRTRWFHNKVLYFKCCCSFNLFEMWFFMSIENGINGAAMWPVTDDKTHNPEAWKKTYNIIGWQHIKNFFSIFVFSSLYDHYVWQCILMEIPGNWWVCMSTTRQATSPDILCHSRVIRPCIPSYPWWTQQLYILINYILIFILQRYRTEIFAHSVGSYVLVFSLNLILYKKGFENARKKHKRLLKVSCLNK